MAEIARREQERATAWRTIARPEQLRPEGCREFILLGGRGSGKTRAGAEDCLERCREGGAGYIAHATSPTVGDAIGVLMDGPSGIKACARPGEIVRTKYDKSALLFELRNGAVIRFFGMDQPDRLNGPQCHHWWADEFGLTPVESLDMANLGNRLAPSTFCGTSTPKPRPGTAHTKGLFPDAVIRRMRMQDNRANLDAAFLAAVERKYAGTRLGKAEIEGLDVEDVEGALWRSEWFDREGFRLPPALAKVNGEIVVNIPPGIVKTVVAIDPSVSDPERAKNPNKELDACGIAAVGADALGNGYVLADFTEVLAPAEWAQVACKLATRLNANEIVYEKNQGGELVREVLKQYVKGIKIRDVWAAQGKRPRAEPVATLYEQGRAFHCGRLDDLEAQMTGWDATDPSAKSPNNLDAVVWGFHGVGLAEVHIPTHHKRTSQRPAQPRNDFDSL